jgi:hypothetical protein
MFRPVLLLSCSVLLAQSGSEWQSWRVISKTPAETRATEAINQRQRFELRQCKGQNTIVTGYERAKATPFLSSRPAMVTLDE